MKQAYNLKDAGLTEDILSKLVIEGDESDQSSVLGTVYMSKKRLLVIQTKIWNDQAYWDFRQWYKNDEGNFLPTKKGFMMASEHKKGDGTSVYPFVDFVKALDQIRTLPDEDKVDECEKEYDVLKVAMQKGIDDRSSAGAN